MISSTMIRQVLTSLCAESRRLPTVSRRLPAAGASRAKYGDRQSRPSLSTHAAAAHRAASRGLGSAGPHRRSLFHSCASGIDSSNTIALSEIQWDSSLSQRRQLSSSVSGDQLSSNASRPLDTGEIERIKKQIVISGSNMTPAATNHASRLLRQLLEAQIEGNGAVGLDAEFINGTLNSYRVLSERAAERARRGKRKPDATFAKKADDLLAFVEDAYAQDPALSPDTKSYGMVIDTYAKLGDPESAETVLLRLEKLWQAGNEKVKPNTILYNAVLGAWAKSKAKNAPQRAEAILQHMEQINRQGDKDVRPDTISFTSVIDAWARSRDSDAPKRAETILAKMEELYRQGNEDVRPNTVTYSAVINAWAKSREKGAAQRAEDILNHMLKIYEGGRKECCPNDRSFNTVIDAWARSRDREAPKRAEALLIKMEELQLQGYKDVRPDTITYISVIDAWAKSREKEAPKRAEALLIKMEELYRQGDEDVRPNIITYGAVINAWAKSRENSAAQRAEDILNHMLKLHEAGREDCSPNVQCVTAVIDAWAKSGDKNAYDRAMKLFRQMNEMRSKDYSDIEPTSVTYNAIINSLAVSSIPDKATKAFKKLLEMENMAKEGSNNLAPDLVTYGAVTKACARTSGNHDAKRKALRVAFEAFDKLRRSALSSANPMIYDSLFHTIANASKGRERAKLATQVFRLCCEDGVLNDFILRNLRNRSKDDLYEKLVGRTGDVRVSDLPPEWSRNSRGF